jgi:mRNA interferase MazF
MTHRDEDKRTLRVLRGDIFLADLSGAKGSEQGGARPVLIVQNNTGNRHAPTTIAAPITSRTKPALPTHLFINGSDIPALHEGSVVLLEQLRTIDKSRLGRYVGSLGSTPMSMADAALAASLGLHGKARSRSMMTLCPVCAQGFSDSGYRLRRLDGGSKAKERCTVCNTRTGFDYEVVER